MIGWLAKLVERSEHRLVPEGKAWICTRCKQSCQHRNTGAPVLQTRCRVIESHMRHFPGANEVEHPFIIRGVLVHESHKLLSKKGYYFLHVMWFLG